MHHVEVVFFTLFNMNMELAILDFNLFMWVFHVSC